MYLVVLYIEGYQIMNYFSEIFLAQMCIIRILTNLAHELKNIMIDVLKLLEHVTMLMTKLAILVMFVLLVTVKEFFCLRKGFFLFGI